MSDGNTEIRVLATHELDEVSGGNAAFMVGMAAGMWLGVAALAADSVGAFDSVIQWKDGKPVGLGAPQ
jgi:hypothetical protein